MPSVVFDSFEYDVHRGQIDCDTDSFKVLLTTNSYVPSKATHAKRSDVTSEVSGAGYATGGIALTCSVTNDTVNHRTELTFANPSWPTATISAARYAVIYKSRGGAASADELVAAVDFGSDVTSSGGTFAVTFTTPLRIANPN